MRIYAIREYWPHEIDDLVEFFLDYTDASNRAYELNLTRPASYDDYTVEEVIVK